MAMQQGRRLIQRGYRVSVIAPHENEEVYDIGEFHPLNSVTRSKLNIVQRGFSSKVRRPISKFDWLYFEHYRAAAVKVLKQLKPDAVLCFNDWQTPVFVKKTVPTARVFLRLSNECRTNMRDISVATNSIERIFSLSNYIRDWTAKEFDIPLDKFVSLPNGADLDSFFPEPDHFERISNIDRPLKALFISRLDPKKGPDLALRSVAALRAEGANIEMSLVGGMWAGVNGDGDPFVEELKILAKATGALTTGDIARPQVPPLVRQHDILLFPVRNNEPMSQVVFEAMASGLAVITCPLGGVPEACGDAAAWVKPDDLDSLTSKLRELYKDRAMLHDYKQRSLSRAKIMTWDSNTDRMEVVLKGSNP